MTRNHFEEALALTRPDYLAKIRASHNQQAQHIARMVEAAQDWAKRPDSEWTELVFLDALSFCGIDDIAKRMADLQHDLRIDAEGVALNDEGDRIEGADRRWVPLKALGGAK